MAELQQTVKPFKLIFNFFTPAITVLVPFIIYFGIKYFGIRYLLYGLLLLYLLRSAHSLRAGMKKNQVIMLVIISTIFGLAIIFNRASLALYTPALINLGLLLSFGSTLFVGPPIIEIFARKHVKSLSENEVKYCRNVTILWSAFFIVNGCVSLAISATGNVDYWIIYNGFISYIMIGLIFIIEMTYRYYRFRNYGDSFIDSFYKRFFKPYSVDSRR
jgi:uncharacterized membrane protein